MLCAIATFFMSAFRPSAAAMTKESAPGSEASSASLRVPAAAAVQPPVGAGDQRRRATAPRMAKLAGQVCIWCDRLLRDAGAGIDAEHEEDRRRAGARGKSVLTPASEATATASSPPATQPAGMPSELRDEARRRR